MAKEEGLNLTELGNAMGRHSAKEPLTEDQKISVRMFIYWIRAFIFRNQ